MKKFTIEKHNLTDKSFRIIAPKNMYIYILVDFDDVGHPQVNKEAKAITKVLNNHLDELEKLCR